MNSLKLSKLEASVVAIAISFSTVLPTFAQNTDAILSSVVEQQRRQLPLVMDAESTVDNVAFANKKLEYTITIPGYQGRPGEQGYYQSFLTQQIMGTLCKQTAYLFVLALGNQISYRYIDSKGGPITEVTLSEKSCQPNG
jgi:hypothetical protein